MGNLLSGQTDAQKGSCTETAYKVRVSLEHPRSHQFLRGARAAPSGLRGGVRISTYCVYPRINVNILSVIFRHKILEFRPSVTIYPLLDGDDDGPQRTREALPQRTIRP